MRALIIITATKTSESGAMPSEQLLTDMGRYNEELINAGILLAGEGLHPSSKGKRVRFSDRGQVISDGPFPDTETLVAGFWIWKVSSMDEALQWVSRCPNPMPGDEAEIEIRPIFELEDFGPELTPELREQEDRQRAQVEGNRNA
jgi:hypothetical protein